MPTANRQHGFTILGLLFLIAGMGVAMAAVGTLWHTAAQREKENDLLFAGDEYRRAITSFWQASPKGQERLPKNFAELLEDPRFPHTVRHLRRLYPDPMTGSAEWGLVKGPDGGIAGVHSLSEGVPFKQASFPADYSQFDGMPSHRDWVFMIVATQPAGASGAGASPAGKETAGNGGQQRVYDRDEWLSKVYQCEKAKQAAHQNCVPLRGDNEAWRVCLQGVTESFVACIGQ